MERLTEFTSHPVPGTTRLLNGITWAGILDGDIHRLTHGVDHTYAPTSIRTLAYRHAARMGGYATVSLHPGGVSEIQYLPPQE